MMKLFKIIFFFIIVTQFLNCCYQKDNIKYKFYESGELKEKIIYNQKNDSLNFTAYLYYKNGKIHYITTFKNGKRNGKYYSFFENGNVKEEYNFLKGELHGVIRRYTNIGKLQEESLYLYGNHILIKKFSENHKLKLNRSICYLINKGTKQEVGMIITDTNNVVKENLSFFYKVYGQDTININEKNEFSIKFFNKRDDFEFEVRIGEMNKDFTFKDTTLIKKISTMSNEIKYSFIPDKKGYNLLLGKINLRKDTVNLEFPLYKEYYVE